MPIQFLLCGCLRFVEPGSATQIIVGIVFCIGYLSLIAYLTPYEGRSCSQSGPATCCPPHTHFMLWAPRYSDGSDNLFSTVCQVGWQINALPLEHL